MTGFCEACGLETPTVNDDYGVACCSDCGADVVDGMYVEIEHEEPDYDGFDAFLQRD